jgi:O-acetyl-ADP-ribose deacetylase (regulator of RNase III)
MEETRRRYPAGCPTGSAVISGAGELPARYVLHAVGPVWNGGGRGEPEQLASAHLQCLQLARQHDCRSIAFPAISTGVYGYPLEQAAETALDTVLQFLRTEGPPEEVRFVLFDDAAYQAFRQALERQLE